MRTRGGQFVVVLLLIICIGCYIAEVFDYWDASLQPSSDTEFSLLRLILSIGVVFAFVRVVLHLLARTSEQDRLFGPLDLLLRFFDLQLEFEGTHPALSPLRI